MAAVDIRPWWLTFDGRGHATNDNQRSPAPAVTSQPVETIAFAPSRNHSSRLADALLLIFADALDDLERSRIANENRVRALRDMKGLAGSPEEQRLVALVEAISALEHQADLDLRRALRTHPLGQWVQSTAGVGEKQGARLLASIGDPYWHSRDGRPRTVSELWAYGGYHVLHPGQRANATQRSTAGVDPLGPDHSLCDTHANAVGADPSHAADHGDNEAQSGTVGGVAPRRERGQRANWSATAKMRAFLVAESAVKVGVRRLPDCDDGDGYDLDNRKAVSPLGEVYLAGRAKYANAVHQQSCARCGPKGKPAQPGSPLSDGHKHARALRLVAKEILRLLWLEARRLREDSHGA